MNFVVIFLVALFVLCMCEVLSVLYYFFKDRRKP